MGALIRATDWSKTGLGPPALWPRSLKTMLGVVLGSRFPMLLWWGPDLLHLYNDAYRPILRDKHPASLGAPAERVWAEVWDVAGPLARSVQDGGPATWTEDLQLFIHSGTMAEETYFTFSYSPVPDDDGRVGGILNTVQETTEKVQGERQIRMLHDLVARASAAGSEEAAQRIAVEVLAANELDVPFALIYSLDEGASSPRMCAASGCVDPGGCRWPPGGVPPSATEVVLDDLACFGTLPEGRGGARPSRAIVLPLRPPGEASPRGWLVAGISPHRALDERYRRFFRAAADQVMSVVANARAQGAEKKRLQALDEIDRAKTTFFSNVSHELRTPLTLMLGPAEDALSSPEGSLGGEALKMVHRNALRLMKLVNTLLDFARIEAGRMQASYEPCDLAALTTDLSSSFRSAIERAGLVFDVRCEPLPELVHVDRDMWERIVLNLLSNALKFTFEGSIRVSMGWLGDRAELRVSDTGTGIPAEELPHLFERFRRVQGARSRTHEGSGIGLALVHELVRLHGGRVGVDSEPGRGTSFTVSIPRGTAHLAADRVRAEPSAPRPTGTANPFVEEALRWTGVLPTEEVAPCARQGEPSARILVVDDNADLRDYIASLLTPQYAVETAPDGQAALEAAMRERPDLVLTDVMMPRLDGFGLLRALRETPSTREVPVIVLSARADESSVVDGVGSGADDYLVKPFAARELVARVQAHVSLARIRRRWAAELERARDEAEAANRELEAFSYSVAHDLRAPLRSLDGFSQALLEDHADRLDEEGQEFLRYVRESAQQMGQLIDGLLTLSRVTRSELQLERVVLSDLAQRTIARLRRTHPERAVDVVLQEGMLGTGDRRLLAVVYDNLLGNAWKFTARREHARIEVGASPGQDGRCVYFVRDNGAGFDMAFAGKLFGAFQRLHGAGEFEGTGIGLATVQRIIRRHGGRAWAEGEVGRGATVYFTLGDMESDA